MTAQRTFQMLENETLWEVAEWVHALLTRQGIDYAIVGGVAVCLHGYRRNTVDLDLLIRPEDADNFRAAMEAEGFQWKAEAKEFHSPSGVAVPLLKAGEREGPGQPATFPNPGEAKYISQIEGLTVLSLAQLI